MFVSMGKNWNGFNSEVRRVKKVAGTAGKVSADLSERLAYGALVTICINKLRDKVTTSEIAA